MQTRPTPRANRPGVLPCPGRSGCLAGFAMLATVTIRHHLYVRRARTRSVTRLQKDPKTMNTDSVMQNTRSAMEGV